MSKIRTGDEVVVLTGRNKGRRGIVQGRVGAEHILVDGVNVVKKHTKPNPMANVVGGIIEKNLPIHVSNVAVFNATTGKGERVSFQFVGGKKVRVFRSTGEVIADKARDVTNKAKA